MSEQLQLRRGSAAQVAAFTGAQGEVAVDTTNNRLVVQDGSTAGGWPQALATRTAVADAAYAVLVTDRQIAYTTLTAARAVTLPAASAYPVGAQLTLIDESGNCSATLTLTLNRAGSDAINGATSAVVSAPYGYLALESNGSNAWTIVDQAISGNLSVASITTSVGVANGAAGVQANISVAAAAGVKCTSSAAYASNGGGGVGVAADIGSAVTSGARLGVFNFDGVYDGTHTTYHAVTLAAFATENWGATNRGTQLAFQVTANGAITRTTALTIDQTGNVGVGAASPGYRLTVSGNAAALPAAVPTGTIAQFGNADSSNTRVLVDAFNGVPVIDFRRAQGTAASPTAVLSGETLGQFSWEGYNGSVYSGGAAYCYVGAAENWSATAQGCNMVFDVTPPGTTSAAQRLQLTGAGQVILSGAQADQSKWKQTPTTGFSITIGNASTTLLLTPAGTLATGAITMPATPVDGHIVRVVSSQTVSTLTVSANAGQSISGAPSTITATTPFAMIYDLASTAWYRMS